MHARLAGWLLRQRVNWMALDCRCGGVFTTAAPSCCGSLPAHVLAPAQRNGWPVSAQGAAPSHRQPAREQQRLTRAPPCLMPPLPPLQTTLCVRRALYVDPETGKEDPAKKVRVL